MNDFLNINRGGATQKTESVGGGRRVFESDVYEATIKQVYLDAYDSGAKFASVTLTIDGSDYEERLLLTNRDGQGFWTDKEGKPVQFAGLTRFDELMFATGHPQIGPGNVRMWDKSANAFILKQHPTVLNAAGQKILVALLKVVENKQVKGQNGRYVKVNEKQTVNSIEKVARQDRQTAIEAANNVNPPAFLDAWTAKWKDVTKDTYKEQANASSQGIPSAGSSGSTSSNDIFG